MKTKSRIGAILVVSVLPIVVFAVNKLSRTDTTTTYDCTNCALPGPTGTCSKEEVDNCVCDADCPPDALYCTCTTASGTVPKRSYSGTCDMYVGHDFHGECGANANCQGTTPWPGSPTIWACVICDTTGVPGTPGTTNGTTCSSGVVYG